MHKFISKIHLWRKTEGAHMWHPQLRQEYFMKLNPLEQVEEEALLLWPEGTIPSLDKKQREVWLCLQHILSSICIQKPQKYTGRTEACHHLPVTQILM